MAQTFPSAPSEVKINGEDEQDGLATKAMNQVTISAKMVDGLARHMYLIARVSTQKNFSTYTEYISDDSVANTQRNSVVVFIAPNTRFWVRLYARTAAYPYKFSQSYNSTNFWSNRKPVAAPVSPAENAQFDATLSQVFDWTFTDPDPDSSQQDGRIRFRTSATATQTAGPWTTYSPNTPGTTARTIAGGTFNQNTFYDWQVRSQDQQDLWGDWSQSRSFFASGTTTPPTSLSPNKGSAVDVNEDQIFSWTFQDPDSGDAQCNADIRFRVIGTTDWIYLFGTNLTIEQMEVSAGVFLPGFHYEWQARTYDGGPTCTLSTASDWSASADFWSIDSPGSAVVPNPLPSGTIAGALGCGTHRAFIYDRGGQTLRGEVTPTSIVQWGRVRDDLSKAVVTTTNFGVDCGALLGEIRSWMHELVIFRDGERVWEGPITRITYKVDSVQIEAHDVMAYVYRRIMRQGYNDSYKLVNGVQQGLKSIVDRAVIITQNALAPDDPEVLPYLTPIRNDGDALQSRVVADYAKTAWEEIDDMAASAGLDYTTAGRRIIYWDTHRPIGKLVEMSDGDFSDPPVVTEYGMSLATYYAVTNNNGVWGAVAATEPAPTVLDPDNRDPVPFKYYGLVELLVSAYGESAGGADETLTASAKQALVKTLTQQASRGIADRWPTPLVVRVPDNSTLSPEVNVSINHLIPGVWIPLSAQGTVRKVRQWQKLDSITVVQDDKGEKVQVVMSPAPDENRDPDADVAAQEV